MDPSAGKPRLIGDCGGLALSRPLKPGWTRHEVRTPLGQLTINYRIAVDIVTGWSRVTVSGDIALETFCKLLDAAWSDAEYSKIGTAIWNFVDARTSMRLDDVMQLTSWIASAKDGRGAKTIAIVAADDLIFGVGRMFHAIQPGAGWTLHVFRGESEATAWLRSLAKP
jgi:hypothetical protein